MVNIYLLIAQIVAMGGSISILPRAGKLDGKPVNLIDIAVRLPGRELPVVSTTKEKLDNDLLQALLVATKPTE